MEERGASMSAFKKSKKIIRQNLQDRQVYQKPIRTNSSVSFVFLA